MLTDSSKSRAFRVFALQDRRGINARAKSLAGIGSNQFVRLRTKAGANHHVVVLAACVPRDAANAR